MEIFFTSVSDILLTIIVIGLIIFLYFNHRDFKKNEYIRGFDWAAGAILRNEETREGIKYYITCSEAFGTQTKFDEGVLDAVRAIDSLTKKSEYTNQDYRTDSVR